MIGTACSFHAAILLVFPLRDATSLAMGFYKAYSIRHEFYLVEGASNSISKGFVSPYQSYQYCICGHILQVSSIECRAHMLARLSIIFFLPAAHIAPSRAMKTSQQEGSFQIISNLISLCPVTEMCDVISNIVLYPLVLVDKQDL